MTSACLEVRWLAAQAPNVFRSELVKDDAELVASVRDGALDDFEELVRRHQSLVFGILHRYERDSHLLQDLAQDVFVRAWRALGQFDGRAPFSHWLSRITVHVALDHLRKCKRVRNEIGFDDLGEDALDWLRSDDGERELETAQAREILDAALRKLSPEERLVLVLQEIEGRSMQEICAVTGWSHVAARVRAFRARNKLRKVLVAMEAESVARQNMKAGNAGTNRV